MTVDLDADLENADWAKGTWDLPYNNVEDLRAYLDRQGTPVATFKTLPVYKLNVGKAGLEWLKDL
jgi:hypothetical protein